MADAIGIDCGSYKTVLGCVKQRGIEIVLSETSSKWTPTIAAYTDQERLIGDAAVNQAKKNFKNTLQFFGRFLGLNSDCKEQLDEEKKFITNKVFELENKKIGFQVECRGEKQILTPEQIMAFFLKRAKTYFENADMPSNEIVLSVPTYASNVERQAYLDAAEIAGIKCVRLINESTAIALNYGFFRKADLSAEKPRIVCFIDFGHSKLTVTYAQFLPGKTKILATHSDRNLGARQIDYLLFELFSAEFDKKHKCDPRENPKARLRMLDSIEKMRKLLTGNKDADLHCDSLLEDIDFHKHFTREDLESLIGPFIERFKICLMESITISTLDPSTIDFVELVGDSTRMPIVIETIKKVYGKEELSRTLNSQETVARGCALQAAMLSPNFQVANFEIEEYNPNAIHFSYKFYGSENVVTKELFKVGSSFPYAKNITFENKVGGLDLLINYDEKSQIVNGLPKQIAQYKIPEGKLDEGKDIKKHSFTMRVSNNIHNIAQLEDAEIIQEWVEEEKIAVKTGPATAPAPEKKEEEKAAEGEQPKPEAPPAQQQYEIKKKNKKNFTKLKFQTSNFALAPALRKQYKDQEDFTTQGDQEILVTKNLRNTVEAYAYDMRGNIDSYGSLEKYIDPVVRTSFLKEIEEVVGWLYGEGEFAQKEEYTKRLDRFKQIGEPVKARHLYYTELDVYLGQFDKVTENIQQQLGVLEFLPNEQRDAVIKKFEVTQEFINKVKADRSSKQLFQDPEFTYQQINNTIMALKKETESIFANAPKTAPVEVPQSDVEMKENVQEENKDVKKDEEMTEEQKAN